MSGGGRRSPRKWPGRDGVRPFYPDFDRPDGRIGNAIRLLPGRTRGALLLLARCRARSGAFPGRRSPRAGRSRIGKAMESRVGGRAGLERRRGDGGARRSPRGIRRAFPSRPPIGPVRAAPCRLAGASRAEGGLCDARPHALRHPPRPAVPRLGPRLPYQGAALFARRAGLKRWPEALARSAGLTGMTPMKKAPESCTPGPF